MARAKHVRLTRQAAPTEHGGPNGPGRTCPQAALVERVSKLPSSNVSPSCPSRTRAAPGPSPKLALPYAPLKTTAEAALAGRDGLKGEPVSAPTVQAVRGPNTRWAIRRIRRKITCAGDTEAGFGDGDGNMVGLRREARRNMAGIRIECRRRTMSDGRRLAGREWCVPTSNIPTSSIGPDTGKTEWAVGPTPSDRSPASKTARPSTTSALVMLSPSPHCPSRSQNVDAFSGRKW